jgi:hypothetical protein
VNHAHRWLIEMPNGPTSNAVCKTCGAEKQFPNYIEESFVMDYNVRRERRELQKLGVR